MELNNDVNSYYIIELIRDYKDIYFENKFITDDLIISEVIFNIDKESGMIISFKSDYANFIKPIGKNQKFVIEIKSKLIFYNCIFNGIVSLGGVNLTSPEASFIIRFENEVSFEKSKFLGDTLCFSSEGSIFLNKISFKDVIFTNEPHLDNNFTLADFSRTKINDKDYKPF